MVDWPQQGATSELDADTDSPKNARPQLYTAVQSVNSIIANAAAFDTRSDITGATVDSAVNRIVTSGYSSVGDGGGGLYARAGSEPSHALKVQSSDGAWWELVPEGGVIDVRQAGAVGDDTTDDGQAFLDALDGVEDFNASGVNVAVHGVLVPPGEFYLGANTLELKKRVRFSGSGSGMFGQQPSVLRWDSNITGIIVHREDTTGATTEGTGTGQADGSIIEGFKLLSDGGTIAGVTDDTNGHGIWLRAAATLRDIVVEEFPGNGIHIVATSGGAAAVDGNANLWRIDNARCNKNHQNGVYVDGSDANAGLGALINASSNGRWGIYDSSFLGNTWIGCHTSNNGVASVGENGASESSIVNDGSTEYVAALGATEAELVATTPGTDETVWITIGSGTSGVTWASSQPEGTYFVGGSYASDNANARTVFVGCYDEGWSNQGPAQLVKPAMILSGHKHDKAQGTGFVMAPDSSFNYVSGRWRFDNREWKTSSFYNRELAAMFARFEDFMFALHASGDHARGVNFRWNEGDGTWEALNHGSDSDGPISVTTDLATGVQAGRSSALASGEVGFKRGLFIGAGDSWANSRLVSNDTAAPASGGPFAVGEFRFNRAPSTGEPLGWVCTSAGSPGTWEAVYGVADQFSSTGTTTGFTAGAGTSVLDDSTFTGNIGSTAYTIGDVVAALKTIGILAD